ncbi:hypothetical protein [Paenibacillus wynnii]|uniref:hypothetical protein n=1 Tax=Paenibacillus wynnii TaxID=268407 RepID=UPI00279104B0|nr:hypothetical protein [Paenibacillus wynnii]MDQ0192891.1 cytoskeletal protein CcmA (bactofilin family) [Paenibacillus wynnii]
MAEQIRSNLKIVGNTTTSGGYFRHVGVTGECKFTGDVDCQKLSLTGELKVLGNLHADELKITGECAIEGRVEGSSLKGRGELKIASDLKIERIRFTGNLAVKGHCESENLHIFGAIQVEGLLSADQLEIGLYGPSIAKEVGGGSIIIKRSTAAKIVGLMKPRQDAYFVAELIEGDLVDLQNAKAGIVRGKHVIIGADCEINTVEYLDTLEIHKGAKVRQQIKL